MFILRPYPLFAFEKGKIKISNASLKSLQFILAESGNSIIATACPLKSS